MATSRTVVVSVDGGTHSKAAFDWYLANVWRADDLVIVTHIPEPPSLPSFSFKSPLSVPVEEWQAIINEAMVKVRTIEEDYQETLIQRKVIYRMEGTGKDKPGPGVIAVADEVNADLIVCGTRGLSALKRVILGSVSDYVVHNTTIPVIICPPPVEED